MSAELYETFAWAKASKDAPFAPLTIKRNVRACTFGAHIDLGLF
jgi:hypothetical protein